MVEAHGGSMIKFNEQHQAKIYRHVVYSQSDGYLSGFDTKGIGKLLSQIGGGRLNNSDGIDNYAGVKISKKISDGVLKDEPVLEFCCSSEQKINNLKEFPAELFQISNSSCEEQQLIYK